MRQLTILILLLNVNYLSIAQTSLYGKLTDKETGEELIGANIILEQNGIFRKGVVSDFNGIYEVDIDPGIYDVHATMIGYPKYLIKDVILINDQANKLEFVMESCLNSDSLIIKKYNKLKIKEITKSIDCFVYSRRINPLPSRTITLIETASSKCKFIDVDHENTMRWVWEKNIYLDGVRVDKNVSHISSFDIDRIQVFDGGVPAAFDDSCDSFFTLLSN